MEYDAKRVAEMRERFPRGSAVYLERMGSTESWMSKNVRGRVLHVDGAGAVFCRLENGWSVQLNPDEDTFYPIEDYGRGERY